MVETNRQRIEHIARRLESLLDDMVFIGGATTELLITAPYVRDIRATKDVDLIVDVLTRVDYYKLSDRLRALGFQEKAGEGHPICRWTIDGILVDIMPINPDILGFSNQWYADAIHKADSLELTNEITIRVISPPYFLATKLEAFHGRGEEDIYTSHDMEDILTLIDGRSELMDEVCRSSENLRQYLAEQFSALLSDRDFSDAIYGFFPGDPVSQARVPQVMDKCRELGRI